MHDLEDCAIDFVRLAADLLDEIDMEDEKTYIKIPILLEESYIHCFLVNLADNTNECNGGIIFINLLNNRSVYIGNIENPIQKSMQKTGAWM